MLKGIEDHAALGKRLPEDGTACMTAEEALQRQIQFEGLLSDLTARFADMPVEEIEGKIEDSLRHICSFLDIDSSTLWMASREDPGTMLPKYTCQVAGGQSISRKPGAPPPPFPWSLNKLLDGEILIIKSMSDPRPKAARDPGRRDLPGASSTLLIPFVVREKGLAAVLAFCRTGRELSWTDATVEGLRLAAHVLDNALERARTGRLLGKRLKEIGELRRLLKSRNISLGEKPQLHPGYDIVGHSVAIKTALIEAGQVAMTDSAVLIIGETGTGKELLARAIHGMSLRRDRPLVTVNCAALPPTLIESELFGREKGAYTGAMTQMIGRFESADGGTLFLDEVGELPLELQNKFLRVVEQGVFERLGSTRSMKVNFRLIAATNRDLDDDIRTGRFRKDLYYRLNVFPIIIPPLRERVEDIPLLVWAFVNEFQERMGKRIETISKKSMQAMQAYSWPGNIRELRNVIERAMIVAPDERLDVTLPGISAPDMAAEKEPQDILEHQELEWAERRHILKVLERVHWRVTGKGSAAEILGLKRSTLQSKMKKLGIKRPVG